MDGTAGAVQRHIWEVFALLRQPLAPADLATDPLAGCFRALREGGNGGRRRAEEEIWAIWCGHPDPDLAAEMSAGIRAMGDGALTRAEGVFDRLIERDAGWAEAWNKRATVYYLQGRDIESVGDILRTLELEPRHFGALGGFAQICLRNGAPDAALAALERLLEVSPGAPGIAEAVETLGRRGPKTLH